MNQYWPSMMYVMTCFTQYNFSSFSFVHICPSLPAIATENVSKSKSIQCCPPPPNAATPRDFRTPPPPVIFRGVKNGVKSEISLQLLSVTSFSYTYFITYFISYFNENVLLTIIINRLSSTLKIVLINCQNFDLTNIYIIANLVQGTKIWNNSELSTPAYAAAAAYFGKTPPSFLKYGGVQH